MSSGYVAIPFVVDMNAARISAPWLDQLLSLVQQIGAAMSNRIVGPAQIGLARSRRTECEVLDIPRGDKDGWDFARSASRPPLCRPTPASTFWHAVLRRISGIHLMALRPR